MALFYVNWLFEVDFYDDQNVWRQIVKILKYFKNFCFLKKKLVEP